MELIIGAVLFIIIPRDNPQIASSSEPFSLVFIIVSIEKGVLPSEEPLHIGVLSIIEQSHLPILVTFFV